MTDSTPALDPAAQATDDADDRRSHDDVRASHGVDVRVERSADDAATHVPSLNGSNGTTAFTVPASVMPPTVTPTRTSTSRRRTATPDARRGRRRSRRRPPRHLHRIVTPPPPESATSTTLRPR